MTPFEVVLHFPSGETLTHVTPSAPRVGEFVSGLHLEQEFRVSKVMHLLADKIPIHIILSTL